MPLPDHIGRFKVVDLIGAGNQGIVLKAVDEQLGRSVAIKILKDDDALANGQSLLHEARIAAQLQHANIVTVHEIGSLRSLPYIVFEYVDGETLKQRIKGHGAMKLLPAVILMSQILAGITHLQKHGIVHRDLKPANILLAQDGKPKVTDFGISTAQYSEAESSGSVVGSLAYMAPEAILGDAVGLHSDVFSLGLIFFEILTGKMFIRGHTPADVAWQIAYGESRADELEAAGIDQRLAAVVLKATQRDPTQRYATAREMKNALNDYRIAERAPSKDDAVGQATVQFVLRRLRHMKGFSALSAHISEVLDITSDSTNSDAKRIANIVGKDITLSQRVLSAANSAFYGGEITTLRQGIVLLGLDQIRLLLIRTMVEGQFDENRPELKQALVSSFFSAVLSRELATRYAFQKTADVYMCGLFHDLGRSLTIHYLYDEFIAIQDTALEQDIDEITASRRVLDIAYHELGALVAKEWKLPSLIVESMRPLNRGDLPPLESPTARVHFFVAFAGGFARMLVDTDPRELAERVDNLLARSAEACPIERHDLWDAYERAAAMTNQYARLIKYSVDDLCPEARLLQAPELEDAIAGVSLARASSA